MGLFGPKWWHHHGIKLEGVRYLCLGGGEVRMLLQSSASDLEIRAIHIEMNEEIKRIWVISWHLIYSFPDYETRGRTWVDDEGLARAFGIDDSIDPYGGEWLVKQYGATTAKQGSFIREGDYLNIPCPGTGHDGDPNISISISQEIKDAITKMLASK